MGADDEFEEGGKRGEGKDNEEREKDNDLDLEGFGLGFNLGFYRVLNGIFEGFLEGLGFRVLRGFWKDFLRVFV